MHLLTISYRLKSDYKNSWCMMRNGGIAYRQSLSWWGLLCLLVYLASEANLSVSDVSHSKRLSPIPFPFQNLTSCIRSLQIRIRNVVCHYCMISTCDCRLWSLTLDVPHNVQPDTFHSRQRMNTNLSHDHNHPILHAVLVDSFRRLRYNQIYNFSLHASPEISIRRMKSNKKWVCWFKTFNSFKLSNLD